MSDPVLSRPVAMGAISGLSGVRGWVKIYSHTRPMQKILDYEYWWLGQPRSRQCYRVIEGREQGKTLVAQLAPAGSDKPISDRDSAAALHGLEIAVDRSQLPELFPGRYYWIDLVGLEVVTLDEVSLGQVTALMETGANDVLVVTGTRERLIPLVMDEFIKTVDLTAGFMEVDWDPNF